MGVVTLFKYGKRLCFASSFNNDFHAGPNFSRTKNEIVDHLSTSLDFGMDSTISLSNHNMYMQNWNQGLPFRTIYQNNSRSVENDKKRTDCINRELTHLDIKMSEFINCVLFLLWFKRFEKNFYCFFHIFMNHNKNNKRFIKRDNFNKTFF